MYRVVNVRPESPQARIGEAVKRSRSSAGLTARDVGVRAGVSHVTVLRVERGENTNIDSVVRVLRTLKLSVAEFMDEPVRTVEDLVPGWNALTADERLHVRALIAAIASREVAPARRTVATLPPDSVVASAELNAEQLAGSDTDGSKVRGRRVRTSRREAGTDQGSADSSSGARR